MNLNGLFNTNSSPISKMIINYGVYTRKLNSESAHSDFFQFFSSSVSYNFRKKTVHYAIRVRVVPTIFDARGERRRKKTHQQDKMLIFIGNLIN